MHLVQGDFAPGRPAGRRLHHPAPAHRPQLAGVAHQAEAGPRPSHHVDQGHRLVHAQEPGLVDHHHRAGREA